MVDEFLARAAPPAIKEPVLALVSPHAGYVYSGGVAAHSYALLKGRKFDRVVVISPSHVEAFNFSSVYDGDAYATPLGTIPVDKAFAAKLASLNPSIKLSSRGHAASGGQAEHALEVQLPFLQRVLGPFKLVPIVMGQQDYDTCRALGVSLAKLIQGPDTLLVASSDLSHFHPYDIAVKLDRKTLQAIEEWDYLSMSRNFELRVWEACGGGPIVAAMIAAERLGANRARSCSSTPIPETPPATTAAWSAMAPWPSSNSRTRAAPIARSFPSASWKNRSCSGLPRSPSRRW